MQIDEDKYEILLPKIAECFMVPIVIHGIKRYIPIEMAIGKRWKDNMQEVKIKL